MDARMRQRILHGYRHMAAGRFYVFNQGVRRGVSSGKIPASVWGANPDLPGKYLEASEQFDEIFHEAKHGSDLMLLQRDAVQRQIVEYLDEMAPFLEAGAVRNPELLINSGFDLAKERRSTSRTKPVPTPDVSTTDHQGNNQ